MDYIDFMLWKLLAFFLLSVVYGFIRRRRELMGEPVDREEEG